MTSCCVAARSTIRRRLFVQPTATPTSRITVTTTASVLGVPCLAGIRQVTPAERARVQSPSPSHVGLLFVSLRNGRSAKYKTDPAGLAGRKARTSRRIILLSNSDHWFLYPGSAHNHGFLRAITDRMTCVGLIDRVGSDLADRRHVSQPLPEAQRWSHANLT